MQTAARAYCAIINGRKNGGPQTATGVFGEFFGAVLRARKLGHIWTVCWYFYGFGSLLALLECDHFRHSDEPNWQFFDASEVFGNWFVIVINGVFRLSSVLSHSLKKTLGLCVNIA